MLEFINFYLVPALVLGCIYALGAIGVSMIFSILRFAHFAHGDLMAVGAYITLGIVALFDMTPLADMPINLKALLTLPLAAGGTVVTALVIDRLFYKPFRTAKPIILVIASFGVALMARSLIMLFAGAGNYEYAEGVISVPLEALQPLRLLSRHIYIFIGTGALVFGLHYLLTRTRTGKAMRAMSDDADLARVSGINTERVIMWTWIVGGSLVACAGVFLGLDSQVRPAMGWDLLLPIFAAAILGGLGRPYGAIAGGLVIGAMEELSTYPWIGNDALISPNYKTAVAFGVMVLLLIFRPQGLFKGRVL
jgi:branched-chain amino acid transport system permease protein